MKRAIAMAAQGLFLGGLFALAGCGGGVGTPAAAPEAVAPEPAPAAPVTSTQSTGPVTEVDALLHDLRAQAERIDAELDRKHEEALALESGARSRDDREPAPSEEAPRKAGAGAGGPREKPRPKDFTPSASEPQGTTAQPESGLGGPCDLACRALASMERSATRICELVGEAHETCVNARALVKKSHARLTSSRCWCQTWGPPPT